MVSASRQVLFPLSPYPARRPVTYAWEHQIAPAPATDVLLGILRDVACGLQRHGAKFTPPRSSLGSQQRIEVRFRARNKNSLLGSHAVFEQRFAHGKKRGTTQAGSFIDDQEHGAAPALRSNPAALVNVETKPAIKRVALGAHANAFRRNAVHFKPAAHNRAKRCPNRTDADHGSSGRPKLQLRKQIGAIKRM